VNTLPRLSIVTISFNQARFLGECMDSIVRQKTDGVEYIAVDPGSTDGSRELLKQSPGIDRLIMEPDAGPADGLNKGFAAATGEVYGYINADDRLAPGAIEFVRRFFAENPAVDVLCGAIRIFDEDGRVSLRARTADLFDARRYAAGVCTVGQQGTFFRREAFLRAGCFRVANRVAWDGELLVDLHLSGARFATTRRILGDFRVYPGTISNSDAYHRKCCEYLRDLHQKLHDRGIAPFPPSLVRIARLAYKLNALRHLDYVLARLTNPY
jgi:glycosyltransferase involved in cell wall biosynthesis